MDHVDEIMDAFEHWLNQTLPTIEDRLLVPRVRLAGKTTLHDQFLSRQESIESSLRAIAVSHGSGQVWLERLRVKTQLPDRSHHSAIADDKEKGEDAMRGPAESIQAVVADILNASADDWLKQELADLVRKLPAELTDDPATLLGDGEAAAERWIADATAELNARLQGAQR
jgi:hypothetical protein